MFPDLFNQSSFAQGSMKTEAHKIVPWGHIIHKPEDYSWPCPVGRIEL